MDDLLTISNKNWERARNDAESKRYPLELIGVDPVKPILALPEMPISAVDCKKYQLLHIIRFDRNDYTSKLEVGYLYSLCPYQPYAEQVNVAQWQTWYKEHPTNREGCKACRMKCQCQDCRVEEILPRETIVHVGKDDIVRYAYHKDGTKTVTIRRNLVGDSE